MRVSRRTAWPPPTLLPTPTRRKPSSRPPGRQSQVHLVLGDCRCPRQGRQGRRRPGQRIRELKDVPIKADMLRKGVNVLAVEFHRSPYFGSAWRKRTNACRYGARAAWSAWNCGRTEARGPTSPAPRARRLGRRPHAPLDPHGLG